MVFIFDACTIINMLHIDEDEFLLKQLNDLDFRVCHTVYREINSNVYEKLKKFPVYPDAVHKEIEKKVHLLRGRVHPDEDYLALADDVKSATGYHKENGEFFSTVLSAYMNTMEKVYVHFYTDDRPARDEFLPFLTRNLIGAMGDSVDLLILLYRHNPIFNKNDLRNYLSKLFSEYVSDLAEIEKAIVAYQIPQNLIRNPGLRSMRDNLLKTIHSRDIPSLQSLYFAMYDDMATYRSLIDRVSKFDAFFKQNISREYLDKITACIAQIDEQPFFKWAS